MNLAFVETGPILLRFAGLHLTPAHPTVVAWVKAFNSKVLEKLLEPIRGVRLRRGGALRPHPADDRRGRNGPPNWRKVDGPKWASTRTSPRIRVGAYIEGLETRLRIAKWDRGLPIVVYRKLVSHASRKNFQLDLFSPDDGTIEYSAVSINKALGVSALSHFINGGGGDEKNAAKLKSKAAFATIPTNDRNANTAWRFLAP